MFKGISTLLITLALIFLVIALILLVLDIVISKMFKNFSSIIESQLQSTLESNIDEVIDSSFWFKVIAFLVGRKKLKAKIESESSDVIDSILKKFKHKISIELLGTMFIFLIMSVIMCAMFTAVYQLDNSVNATIHTTIDFITDRKEAEEESEVEDTWVWDDIPDEELYTLDEMQSGESSNTADKNITSGTGNYTGGGPDKAYGHADGKCVVALDDGNYFWYHQSTGCNVTCSWCGNWSKSEWGDSNYHLLGTDGCAVYAMAIVVSNLIGDEVTPLEIMEAAGCTITLKNDGTYKINTSTSNCFSNRSVSYSTFAKKMAEVYNLDYQSVSIVDNGSVVGANQSAIDNYLADGYYIWGMFDKFKTTWCSNTNSNSANTHFMGIRKKVGNNYYCFTSCKGRCSSTGGSTGAIYTMNYPQGIDSSINAFKFGSGRHAYAFKYKGGTSSLKTVGGGIAPGQYGENPMKPPGFTTISDADIQNDISRGLYSKEDYEYLVALSGESSSYEGFYAVACAVRNRVIKKNSTYKNQVTATGQFTGYNSNRVGKPINEQVKCAAVQVLRGERSTVSECMYFFGRVNGYHLWIESDEKYVANWSNNIYYSTYGKLHNASSRGPESNDIIIYNKDTKVWNISSGMLYKLQ